MAKGEKNSAVNRPLPDPRFPLIDEIPPIKLALDRHRTTIECMMNAIKKYNAACQQASEKLTADLQNCLAHIDAPVHRKKTKKV